MTDARANHLIKTANEIKSDFFDNEPDGLGYIYDTLLEMPGLIRSYKNELDETDYDKIKGQLKKYKKAIAAVRELATIEYVFS